MARCISFCMQISFKMANGYIATSAEDLREAYLHGQYKLVSADLVDLKKRKPDETREIEKLEQLKFLMMFVVTFRQCEQPNIGFNYYTAAELAKELDIPPRHLILMEEACEHPYYYGNISLTGSSIKELFRRFSSHEIRRTINSHFVFKVVDYFEQALANKYELDISPSCDYLLFYPKRFNILMDSLSKSCHHFDKFVILNEATKCLRRPITEQKFHPSNIRSYYVLQAVIDYVYESFSVLKANFKQAVNLETTMITSNWYEVSISCESTNAKDVKMTGYFLNLVIDVVISILKKYDRHSEHDRFVYCLTYSSPVLKENTGRKRSLEDDDGDDGSVRKKRKVQQRPFEAKNIVKTKRVELTKMEQLNKLLLKGKTGKKRSLEDDDDDSVRKKRKAVQEFRLEDIYLKPKRLEIITFAKYTINAVIHGLNTYGIKCMTVNDRDKHIDHINNHVVHVKLTIKSNAKFLNKFREKSLVKSRLIKTNNITVSIYKNMKDRRSSLNELVISLNVSGHSDLIRIGLLNIRKMGNADFVLTGQLKVSYTCQTNRSSMVAHSNPLSFRTKCKKKNFWGCRKVENFNAMIVGSHGEACIVHKACLLPRCRDKKNTNPLAKRLLSDGYETNCSCNTEYERIGRAIGGGGRVKGICCCEKECCEDVRLKVLNKCLKDVNEVMEKPMPSEWSEITYRLERARGEIINTVIDTGLKLSVISESMTLETKRRLFELMENDDYVIISRYLVSQNDMFALIKPVTINGSYPQTSKLPLVYSSKKNRVKDAAIRFRPEFIERLEKTFGSDVSTNRFKSIIQNKGSCNLFVKLPNVSNVVFNSDIYGTFITDLIRTIRKENGDEWKSKFPDTYALFREITRARDGNTTHVSAGTFYSEKDR